MMTNPSKVDPEDYVDFLIGSQTKFTCTEAARTEPEGDNAAQVRLELKTLMII